MTWTVTVLFDHMLVDETHYFENEAEARLEHGWVEVITQGDVITNQE
ncbi:TPA: hypothetical protein ACGO2Q_002316 [Streptococcus suis]